MLANCVLYVCIVVNIDLAAFGQLYCYLSGKVFSALNLAILLVSKFGRHKFELGGQLLQSRLTISYHSFRTL